MAKINLNITNEHIKLIKCLNFKVLENFNRELSKREGMDLGDCYCGIDTYDLYGGTYLYEQMAYILGYHDQVIEGTENDVDGPKYPKEIMDKFYDLDEFMVQNLTNIEEIIHQFCMEGIKPGKYTCKDYQHIWSYVPEKTE